MSDLLVHPAQHTPDPQPRSYAPIVVGVTLAILALHTVVTRPLLKRIDALNAQVLVMQSELDAVAGSQADAWRTNDLLTALTIQAERLDSADLALTRFDGLAERLDTLNSRVVALSTQTDDAFRIVADFDSLHDRLTAAAGMSGAIDEDLREIEAVTDRVDAMAALTPKHRDALDVLSLQSSEMMAIAARVAGEEMTIAEAQVNLVELTELTDKLAQTDPAKAIDTSDKLITMASSIAEDGHRMVDPANQVLAGLREATSGLDRQSERLASLIDSAEALEDFEREIALHIQDLHTIRRDLLDVAMMETTVRRVATTLEPLTELVRLRRMQPDDLRVAVESLKQQRQKNGEMLADDTAAPVRKPIQTADRLVPEPVGVLR